jgi:hypothetical protein
VTKPAQNYDYGMRDFDVTFGMKLRSQGCGPVRVKLRRTQCEQMSFAVGTRVTPRPPHRSVRAQFGHTAPTSGV